MSYTPRTALDVAYVDVAGDTMTGELIASADPAAVLQVGTRRYMEDDYPFCWRPKDQGFITWNFEPMQIGGSDLLSSGFIYMSKINITKSASITGIALYIATAGSTLTAGQNFIGLYTAAGSRVAVSADMGTGVISTGFKKIPFTAPYAATAGTFYTAYVVNGANRPRPYAASMYQVANLNIGMTAAPYKFGHFTGANTSLPASLTMTSMVASGYSPWIALY